MKKWAYRVSLNQEGALSINRLEPPQRGQLAFVLCPLAFTM